MVRGPDGRSRRSGTGTLFLPGDRVWLLALPVYLLVLIFRHEAGHALSAVVFDGARLTSFSVLPSVSADGSFIRPHVRFDGSASLMTGFAPYLLDAVGFLLFLPICWFSVRIPRWIWLNLVIFGLFIPILDSVGNYGMGLVRARSDVGLLLASWPEVPVHLYFLGTAAAYAYGSYRVLRRRQELSGTAPGVPPPGR